MDDKEANENILTFKIIKEEQIKTVMRYHYTPVINRISKIQN